jgi:Kef-type K+ transport system membrane component KefB
MIEIHSLLIIAFVAVLAPLINKLPLRVRIPVIVIELVMGILIGWLGYERGDHRLPRGAWSHLSLLSGRA